MSERVAPIVTPLVPAAELVVAVALVAWWSAVPGVVALVLLAAFTVVLVRAEARRVPCLCFGSATRRRAGWAGVGGTQRCADG